jgi:hypothetical protein
MIRRLAISEIYPTIWKVPAIEKTESSFPTIQYWEGDPPPPEINSEINAWRRDSPPLSHHLYNAAEADQWISRAC